MGREISWEIREKAEELYIVDGKTFEVVSEQTNVSVNQLKNWSKDGGWREARQEYRKALTGIRRNAVLLRKRLIEKAMTSLNPQDVYAVSAMEGAFAKVIAAKAVPEFINKAPTRKIKNATDAVDALTEAIELRVNNMLAKPENLNFSAMKDLKKALELLREIKTTQNKENKSGRAQAVTPEAIRLIEEELGLS